jgi:hypothetical protein
MGSRPAQQLLDETASIALTELERTTGGLANTERFIAAGIPRVAPSHHRTWRALEQVCNFMQGSAVIQQFQRAVTPRLEYFGGALDPHTDLPGSGEDDGLLHYLRVSQ